MNILTAIHRLAETGSGRVKALKGKGEDKRLRVGDFRVRYTDEHPDTVHIHALKHGCLSVLGVSVSSLR